MSLHQRRLKVITLDLGGQAFACQVKSWTMTNNSPDGAKLYSFCPTGTDVEEVDGDWALDVTFFSDWTLNGVSDWLFANNETNVTFQLDHHPDIALEHVRWSGTLRVKAPSVGGEARVTEETNVTLQIVGVPVYARI